MRYGILLIPVLLVIVLALLSGCSSVSMGDLKPGGIFGSASPEQQQLLMCLMASEDYIDPQQVRSPRFEQFNSTKVILTSRLVNETPVDDLRKFPLTMDRLYYWAFYEGCQPGDRISMRLSFSYIEHPGRESNAVIILETNQTVSGQYGPVYGSIQRPDAGWMPGRYDISLHVTRGSNTTSLAYGGGGAVTTDGPAVTSPLPCHEILNPAMTLSPGAMATMQPVIGTTAATPSPQPSASPSPSPAVVPRVSVRALPPAVTTTKVPVQH